MSMRDPSLHLRVNQKTGDFVIVNYAVDRRFGFLAGWGPLVHVARQQMKTEGLRIVLDNLDGFLDRNGEDGCELDGDPVKQREFEKLHKCISIMLLEQRNLAITPMRGTRRGGATGEYEDVITLPFPCTNEEFYRALELAESRAQ